MKGGEHPGAEQIITFGEEGMQLPFIIMFPNTTYRLICIAHAVNARAFLDFERMLGF
jgi:hypothetical protein